MWKKILIGFLILLLVLSGFLYFLWTKLTAGSTEAITADLKTEELFQSRCGICHNGAAPDAPSVASLQLLSEEAILTAMKSGVMKNQAMHLTDQQHKELAAYISGIDPNVEAEQIIKGKCADEDISQDLNAYPRVDSRGIGYENQRFYNGADL